MKRLAIVTTHPIQYHAPLFKSIAERGCIALKVFYTWGKSVEITKYDPGFGKEVRWDIPLLNGYDYQFLPNSSHNPGSHHYSGIQNPSIIEEIKNWRPTAILVFGWKFKSHLECLRYFKGKLPVLFRGDSTLLDYRPWNILDKIKYLFLYFIYRNVDKALYVGSANLAYFKKCGIHESNLVHFPHTIDIERFASGDGKQVRKRLNLQDHEILILFSGKLEHKKNPLLLIRVFEQLKAKHMHLLLVGSGPLESDIQHRISKMDDDTARRIHLWGFQNQSNMPDIYKAADLFVLPSKGPDETWGLVINEAMAASKAVIASDKCGASFDLIFEGYNGYIFPSDNERILHYSIERAVNSKQQLTEMGQKSFEIIKRWNIQHASSTLESIIGQV